MKVSERINGLQLFQMLLPTVLATGILTVPTIIAGYANQDAWLSVFVSSISGFWSVLIMIELAKRYPNMTPVEYSRQILGPWVGTIYSLWMVVYFFIGFPPIGFEVSNFLATVILPTTPSLVITGSIYLIVAYAVRNGIEVIGRCSQFIVPFNSIGFALIFLLTIQDMDFTHLQPVLEKGMMPILKGAVAPADWLGQLFLIGFLFPYVNEQKGAIKAGWFSAICIPLLMLVAVLQSTLVLGNITPKLTFPAFEVVRYISIADFVERMDPFFASIWIFGVFVKMAVFLFAFCLCVSQVFALPNYRIVLVPLTVLSTIGSQYFFKNEVQAYQFFTFTDPIYAFITQTLLPTLLLLIDTLKKKLGKSKHQPEADSITKDH